MSKSTSPIAPSILRQVFQEDSSLRDHYFCQKTALPYYLSTFFLLMHKKIDLNASTKARAIAASLLTPEKILAKYLLASSDTTLVDVLKSVNLIDSSRKKRALEKKLERLSKQGCKNSQKMGLIRSRINDLTRDMTLQSSSIVTKELVSQDSSATWSPPVGLAGSISKLIRKWLSVIPAEQLKYFALNMPKEPWQELTDIVHAKPSDFSVDWFLTKHVWGDKNKEKIEIAPSVPTPAAEEASEKKEDENSSNNNEEPRAEDPEALFLETLQKKTNDEWIKSPDELATLISTFKAPYSFLRRKLGGFGTESGTSASTKNLLPAAARIALARYDSLETIIWFYEEITSGLNAQETAHINDSIESRLRAGEQPTGSRSNFGKLMERLLLFKERKVAFYPLLEPIAEERLHSLNLELEKPVAVFGDASGSMEVAIKTSIIFGAMLTILTDAELSFFHDVSFKAPLEPKTVKDVIRLTEMVKADCSTCNAASLWPYYEQKKVVKSICMVTDEGENALSHGFNFAQLYEKYRKEVNPNVELIFISFLSQGDKGQMVKELDRKGLAYTQLRMDLRRPDLTKLDAMIGLLSSRGPAFDEEVEKVALEYMQAGTIQSIHEKLKTLVSTPKGEGDLQMLRN